MKLIQKSKKNKFINLVILIEMKIVVEIKILLMILVFKLNYLVTLNHHLHHNNKQMLIHKVLYLIFNQEQEDLVLVVEDSM